MWYDIQLNRMATTEYYATGNTINAVNSETTYLIWLVRLSLKIMLLFCNTNLYSLTKKNPFFDFFLSDWKIVILALTIDSEILPTACSDCKNLTCTHRFEMVLFYNMLSSVLPHLKTIRNKKLPELPSNNWLHSFENFGSSQR